jgi:hypothetical protein
VSPSGKKAKLSTPFSWRTPQVLHICQSNSAPKDFLRSYGQTDFFVTLSEAQDLELIEKTRFFTAFRMATFLSQGLRHSL